MEPCGPAATKRVGGMAAVFVAVVVAVEAAGADADAGAGAEGVAGGRPYLENLPYTLMPTKPSLRE